MRHAAVVHVLRPVTQLAHQAATAKVNASANQASKAHYVNARDVPVFARTEVHAAAMVHVHAQLAMAVLIASSNYVPLHAEMDNAITLLEFANVMLASHSETVSVIALQQHAPTTAPVQTVSAHVVNANAPRSLRVSAAAARKQTALARTHAAHMVSVSVTLAYVRLVTRALTARNSAAHLPTATNATTKAPARQMALAHAKPGLPAQHATKNAFMMAAASAMVMALHALAAMGLPTLVKSTTLATSVVATTQLALAAMASPTLVPLLTNAMFAMAMVHHADKTTSVLFARPAILARNPLVVYRNVHGATRPNHAVTLSAKTARFSH